MIRVGRDLKDHLVPNPLSLPQPTRFPFCPFPLQIPLGGKGRGE